MSDDDSEEESDDVSTVKIPVICQQKDHPWNIKLDTPLEEISYILYTQLVSIDGSSYYKLNKVVNYKEYYDSIMTLLNLKTKPIGKLNLSNTLEADIVKQQEANLGCDPSTNLLLTQVIPTVMAVI